MRKVGILRRVVLSQCSGENLTSALRQGRAKWRTSFQLKILVLSAVSHISKQSCVSKDHLTRIDFLFNWWHATVWTSQKRCLQHTFTTCSNRNRALTIQKSYSCWRFPSISALCRRRISIRLRHFILGTKLCKLLELQAVYILNR